MEHDYSDPPWQPWSICLPGAAHRRDLLNCQDATCTREGTRFRPSGPQALEGRLTNLLPKRLAKLVDVCGDEWTECCYATLVLAERLPVDYRWAARAGEERRPMLSKLVELKAGEVRGAWISTDGARFLTADDNAPPVLAGRAALEAWGLAQIGAVSTGTSPLRDDLGLVAFVPRRP